MSTEKDKIFLLTSRILWYDVSNMKNRLAFEGVLAVIGEPSHSAPSGASGHRVCLQKEGTKKALASLKGQGIGISSDLSTHDPQKRIGVITGARIKRGKIIVKGHLWDTDFPQEITRLQAQEDKLGMSYEIADAFVPDMRQEIWELDPNCFVGAAIVLREKAAHKTTSFKLSR